MQLKLPAATGPLRRNVATLTMEDYGYLWTTLPNKASQLKESKKIFSCKAYLRTMTSIISFASLMEIKKTAVMKQKSAVIFKLQKREHQRPKAHRQALKDVCHSALHGLPHTITLFFVL